MDAHPPAPAPSRRANRTRPVLDRATIVAGALQIIDERGVETLSMRTLGRHLGYEAMALYRHVDGREDLLEGVVEHLMAGLELPPAEGSWEDFVRAFAGEVRDLAHEHPRAFPLVATRHPAAPWLRPPLRSLEVVEHFLASLRELGWDRAPAVEAYQAVSSFLLGYLLLEASTAGAPTAPVDAPMDEGQVLDGTSDQVDEAGDPLTGRDREVDVTAYPTLTDLQPLLAVDRSDEEFAAGLESVVTRLRGRFEHASAAGA